MALQSQTTPFSQDGDFRKIRRLLQKHRVNVNARDPSTGNTALMVASLVQDPDVSFWGDACTCLERISDWRLYRIKKTSLSVSARWCRAVAGRSPGGVAADARSATGRSPA